MKILKFDNCEYLTKISDVSCLPNLEEFSFKKCKNLITIDKSIGFLSKLKTLDAGGCPKLRNFPPLKLPSLERLLLSSCESLRNFPEILDKMEKLNQIFIYGTSIREIPVSFQNLIGLSKLYYVKIEEGSGNLMFPKSCKMPNVRDVTLYDFNLSLCLRFVIMGFTNMESLDLSGSDFIVLPECLKECTSLHTLLLVYCRSLEVIIAIPPNLQKLFATNCESLNSSSKSMLLNKVLLYFLPNINLIFL
jgi:Leucine-rich repeat (LRR) protein